MGEGKDLVIQELVETTGSADYDLGFSLLEDSELLVFGHTSDYAGHFYLFDWVFV